MQYGPDRWKVESNYSNSKQLQFAKNSGKMGISLTTQDNEKITLTQIIPPHKLISIASMVVDVGAEPYLTFSVADSAALDSQGFNNHKVYLDIVDPSGSVLHTFEQDMYSGVYGGASFMFNLSGMLSTLGGIQNIGWFQLRYERTCNSYEYSFNVNSLKLEISTAPTPHMGLSYADNLAECQKYYYKLTAGECMGVASGQASNIRYMYRHPVQMAKTPVLIVKGNVSSRLGSEDTNISSNPMTGDFVNDRWFSVKANPSYSASFTAPWGLLEGTIEVDAEYA